MKSFKSFLTIILLGGFICAAPQAAEMAPTSTSTPTPAPAAQTLGRVVEPGLAAGTDYIGYVWPFGDLDMQKEIDRPVVVELFSTQGCMFCPVADRFFIDLLEKAPNVIGLSCHVDFIEIDPRNPPLSKPECTDRQNVYASNNMYSRTYTPQIVVNAKTQSYGFQFDFVLRNIREALKSPPVRLEISKGQGSGYVLTAPAGAFPDSSLEVLQYLKPQAPRVVAGQNDGIKMDYRRVVKSIAHVEDWQGKGASIPLTIKPEADTAGAVVLLRDKSRGILGVGEVKF